MALIRIREFRYPNDLDAVIHLWRAIEKGIHLGRSDEPAEIEKKLQRDPNLFLVAELDEKIIGSVIGGFDGRRGLIYHLAVAASFRGQGIGSRLMDEVQARLRSKGCLKCYLLVTVDNEEAMQYYEHHGWEHMDGVKLYGKELS
ncbi:MAG: GNAT family N-acetyltransferase [Chloroflexi bacterium]|nr:GNAT family N-acetyltransferase [Chloroflexota bacterium]